MANNRVVYTISLNELLEKDLSKVLTKVRTFEQEINKADAKARKFGKDAFSAPGLDKTRQSVQGLEYRLERLTSLRDRAFDPERVRKFNKEIQNTQLKIDGIKGHGMGFKEAMKGGLGRIEGMTGLPVSGLASPGGMVLGGAAVAGYVGYKIMAESFAKAVELSDLKADVRKSTGMNESEAASLATSLMGNNTRTSLSDQMSIAKIGGQIGVVKSEIESFTKVMDMSVVALSDEFAGGAEEVTRSLGGIKKLYKDLDAKSFTDATVQIGDAINYLGATGTATGPVVSDFVTRMGQLGKLKGTFAEMAGMGAAFQEKGLTAEIAAGGYTNAVLRVAEITKNGDNMKMFAKQMGITNKAAKDLYNSDTTKFMMQFAKSLQGLSNDEIAKTLQFLGIGTQESIKTLQVMASDIDFFNQRIADVGKSVGSQAKEFEIKNNNLAGSVEKLKGSWDNFFTMMGQKQEGFFKAMVDGLNAGVSALNGIINTNENLKNEEKSKALEKETNSVFLSKKSDFESKVKMEELWLEGEAIKKGKPLSQSEIQDLQKQAQFNVAERQITTKALANSLVSVKKQDIKNPFAIDIKETEVQKAGEIKYDEFLKSFMPEKKEKGNYGLQKEIEAEEAKKAKKGHSEKTDLIGTVENVRPQNIYINMNKMVDIQQIDIMGMRDGSMNRDIVERDLKAVVGNAIIEVANDLVGYIGR